MVFTDNNKFVHLKFKLEISFKEKYNNKPNIIIKNLENMYLDNDKLNISINKNILNSYPYLDNFKNPLIISIKEFPWFYQLLDTLKFKNIGLFLFENYNPNPPQNINIMFGSTIIL